MLQTARIDPDADPCDCGRQPIHVITRGREQHHHECPPCKHRTARHRNLTASRQAWNTGRLEPFGPPIHEVRTQHHHRHPRHVYA